MTYSTPAHITRFKRKLGPRPFFVCDMDGNTLKGYTIAPGQSIPLGPTDNSETQGIPFGTTAAEIDRGVKNGILLEGVLSKKNMDSRLPKRLVDIVNANIERGDNFTLGFLTSRPSGEALTILRESGVKEPERVTLVADAGAILYIDGKKTVVRRLTAAEQALIGEVDNGMKSFKDLVKKVVEKEGYDSSEMPDLYLQEKEVGRNVHYRAVLDAFGQKEGSSLDRAIGTALKDRMQSMASDGPLDDDAKPVFTTLNGPATVEIKVAKVNKGEGLKALAGAAIAADTRPSTVIFSDDDISKAGGMPGTGYYGMVAAPELEAKFKLPFFNVHTHHPVGGDLDGTVPDPHMAVGTLPKEFPAPRIDLVVPTPRHLGDIIVDVLSKGRRPGHQLGAHATLGQGKRFHRHVS